MSALAENERDKTVLELLSDPGKIAALSPAARTRAIRTGEILSAAVAQAGRVPLRTLIENTWLLLGGPAILRESYQTSDVDVFFLLLDAVGTGGTILDFTQLNTRLESLFAKGAPDPKSVQVMTIFKAKGLEFDTVILPKLEGITQAPERDLLIWDEEIDDDGSNVLRVAAQPRKGEESKAYREIRETHKYKHEQELKRLLYVACTRAKNALYLVGNAKLKKKDNSLEKPRSGTFLHLLWPAAEQEFQSLTRRSVRQMELPFKSEPQTILRRLPADWEIPRFSRRIRWQPPFQETTPSTRKVTYEWVSDTGRHVGTVVHELLKRAAETNWDSQHVLAMAPIIQSELLRLGVPRADEPAASERVMRAILNTLSSERGRWILSKHAEARSEWPVGGQLGDRIISGTIDRMFRDDDGNLWIIDFKTSEHQGGQIEKFLAEEQRRYQPQLESYAALIAQMSKGPIWLGLYFPLLDAWREWQYQESAALTAT
ncbi:MAG: PD-(D/E)XK nuclease family protein [Acidobacteriaceae bacterium]|nr:PD-(D/E)XK nuclease family protein [Acidobacteriaceae bacterium]